MSEHKDHSITNKLLNHCLKSEACIINTGYALENYSTVKRPVTCSCLVRFNTISETITIVSSQVNHFCANLYIAKYLP